LNEKNEKWIAIGRLGRTKGLSGEIRVKLHNPNSQTLLGVKLVAVGEDESHLTPFSICQAYQHVRDVILGFHQIGSREDAKKLTGKQVFIRRKDFPELAQGEHYSCDLVGCVVEDMAGNTLGVLRSVMNTASNDIYVIDKEGQEILLPVLSGVVVTIDLSKNLIKVNPPEVINAF